MKRIVLAALLLALAVPALADEKFGAMDADKDQKITWDEFKAAHPGMTRAAFDMIDADKNGYLSHEEWDAFVQSHRRGMMGGQEGGGQPGAQPPQSHGGSKPLITPPAK